MTPDQLRRAALAYSRAADWPGLYAALGVDRRTLRRWCSGAWVIREDVTDSRVADAIEERAQALHEAAQACARLAREIRTGSQ